MARIETALHKIPARLPSVDDVEAVANTADYYSEARRRFFPTNTIENKREREREIGGEQEAAYIGIERNDRTRNAEVLEEVGPEEH